MKLEGVIAALTTPFSNDGAVDRAKLRSNVEKYNSTELSGYVAVG
jgi:dihydrodipicolinate synthase/N-acetylneuraminate lyase